MFTNSYFQVSKIFAIIGLTAKSTLKFISDTISKIFVNQTFEMKVVTYSGFIFKHYLQFTTITDVS